MVRAKWDEKSRDGVSRIERRQGEEFREDKVVLFEGKQMDVQMQSG